MKTFVREITWIDYVDHGWGNGYVAVPPTSKLHGLEYDGVDVSVHGGVTYSNLAAEFDGKPDDIPDDWWIFGFDTAHGLDNQLMHDKQYVLNETQSLLEQLKKLEREKDMNDKKLKIELSEDDVGLILTALSVAVPTLTRTDADLAQEAMDYAENLAELASAFFGNNN